MLLFRLRVLLHFLAVLSDGPPPKCPATPPPSLASASTLSSIVSPLFIVPIPPRLAAKRGGRRHRASRVRRRSAGCVTRSSTIRPRRDASAVHRVPRRRRDRSRCVGGPSRAASSRQTPSAVHHVPRRRDRSRCAGGPSRAASSRQTHLRIAVVDAS